MPTPVINMRGMEEILTPFMNLVRSNIDPYLAAVEALYLSDPIALPRPAAANYYMSQRRTLDAAPAVFVLGRVSRAREQTGSHIMYVEPGGGFWFDLSYVMWDDNPETLRKKCYRVARALNQMVASNSNLGGVVDYLMVVDTDFGTGLFNREKNRCEQAVNITLQAQTQEVF